MEAHEKIKKLLNIDMALYRPPFGEYNDTVLNAAKECGYYAIQWDVDGSHIGENGGITRFYQADYSVITRPIVVSGIV